MFSKHIFAFSKPGVKSDISSEVMLHFKEQSSKWTIRKFLDPELQAHAYVAGMLEKASYSSLEKFAKLEDLIEQLTASPDFNFLMSKRVRSGVFIQQSQTRK